MSTLTAGGVAGAVIDATEGGLPDAEAAGVGTTGAARRGVADADALGANRGSGADADAGAEAAALGPDAFGCACAIEYAANGSNRETAMVIRRRM
jgi:hypothetical protein